MGIFISTLEGAQFSLAILLDIPDIVTGAFLCILSSHLEDFIMSFDLLDADLHAYDQLGSVARDQTTGIVALVFSVIGLLFKAFLFFHSGRAAHIAHKVKLGGDWQEKDESARKESTSWKIIANLFEDLPLSVIALINLNIFFLESAFLSLTFSVVSFLVMFGVLFVQMVQTSRESGGEEFPTVFPATCPTKQWLFVPLFFGAGCAALGLLVFYSLLAVETSGNRGACPLGSELGGYLLTVDPEGGDPLRYCFSKGDLVELDLFVPERISVPEQAFVGNVTFVDFGNYTASGFGGTWLTAVHIQGTGQLGPDYVAEVDHEGWIGGTVDLSDVFESSYWLPLPEDAPYGYRIEAHVAPCSSLPFGTTSKNDATQFQRFYCSKEHKVVEEIIDV